MRDTLRNAYTHPTTDCEPLHMRPIGERYADLPFGRNSPVHDLGYQLARREQRPAAQRVRKPRTFGNWCLREKLTTVGVQVFLWLPVVEYIP
jgi:hypothetical protein